MSSSRNIVAVAWLFTVCRSVQLFHEPNQPEGVCISISAYEEPAWVDLLIANALKFSDNYTKIAIHLNSETTYDELDIKRWQTDRTAITEQRIFVRPFRGSLLWSHLLNARTMAKRWGKACKYFVLQASNMMWVRSGMEEQVRLRRFSPLGGINEPKGCPYEERYGKPEWTRFAAKMVEPRGVYGHGQPEGSFFPFKDLLGFKAMLDKYVDHDLHGQKDTLLDGSCYFENTWPQTYMLNFAKLPPDESFNVNGFEPLSFNHMDNKRGKDSDSIPLEEMKAVRNAAKGFESYYAVKRVNRNMSHPITRRVFWLSHN